MQEVDIDINWGEVIPLTVVPTSVDVTILQGAGRLAGWSLRDVSTATPQDASGNVVAPAAGVDIVALTGLPAGTYVIEWTVGLQGAAAAADADNFQLYDTAGNLLVSVNPGAAGDYPQLQTEVTVTAGAKIAVKSIGAGTAAVTYIADLVITPTGEVETIVELQDGSNVLGEATFRGERANTAWFGKGGPTMFGKCVVHVISGTVTGTVYVVPSRGSQ